MISKMNIKDLACSPNHIFLATGKRHQTTSFIENGEVIVGSDKHIEERDIFKA